MAGWSAERCFMSLISSVSIPAALTRLSMGLVYAILYAVLGSAFPVNNIRLDSFAVRKMYFTFSFDLKMIYLLHRRKGCWKNWYSFFSRQSSQFLDT